MVSRQGVVAAQDREFYEHQGEHYDIRAEE